MESATNSIEAQLFYNLPDAAVWFSPYHTDAGTLTGFRADRINTAAVRQAGSFFDRHPLLTADGAPTLYADLTKCFQTGQPQTVVRAEAPFGRPMHLRYSRVGDGVLLLAQPPAEPVSTTRLQRDLDAIMAQAQTGILLLSPVHDATGRLVDFRFELANHTLARLSGQDSPELLVGSPVSVWFPGYRETDVFVHFRQAHETGLPRQFELHYDTDGLDRWFDVVATPLEGDLLVSFTDFTSLKQSQETVQQQASLLHSVLNSSLNGIMAFRAIRNAAGAIVDFTLLSVNQAACGLTGRSETELLRDSLLTTFPGNREAGLFTMYCAVTETGAPARTEANYQHDGLDMWIDISAQQLDDGFVVTFSDISVSKQAQLRAEQQSGLIRTMLDGSLNGILLLDPLFDAEGRLTDFRILAANRAVYELTGADPVAAVGNTMLAVYPSYKENGFFALYADTYATGEMRQKEIYYQDEQLEGWFMVSAARQDNVLVLTFTNTTEIRQQQRALEQAAVELQTIIDTTQTGIYLFSAVTDQAGEVVDFRFKRVNRYLARLVGQEPPTLAGALGSAWFPEYKTNGLFDAYLKTYRTGADQRFDFQYHLTNGQSVWMDIKITRMGTDVLVTFSNFTKLKKLQQQLELTIDDLKRSNANLEQFAYVASHDMQEPLRKIQTFGDVLQTQYSAVLDGAGVTMLDRIQQAANRMQSLIQDVLAYSRLSSVREQFRPVDLAQLVADVLVDLELSTAEKGVVVDQQALPVVPGDRVQLQQLFLNLISNAIKFARVGDPGHTPRIRISARALKGCETDFELLSEEREKAFWLLAVSDNGIGFEPRYAEQIFRVFQRLHTRNEYAGTGVGLAIVQRVVENHRGYVRAEGQPGQGATFWLLLPA